MTQREFFESVIAMCDTAEQTPNTAEIKSKATELIASLDRKNEKRTSADSKEKKEVIARQTAIFNFFKANPTLIATRDDVANAVENVTVGQVTSACTKFVKDGFLQKCEVGKGKDKHTAYQLTPQAEEITE